MAAVLIELEPTVATGAVANLARVLQDRTVALQLVHAVTGGNVYGVGIVADRRPGTAAISAGFAVSGYRAVRAGFIPGREPGSQGEGRSGIVRGVAEYGPARAVFIARTRLESVFREGLVV